MAMENRLDCGSNYEIRSVIVTSCACVYLTRLQVSRNLFILFGRLFMGKNDEVGGLNVR